MEQQTAVEWLIDQLKQYDFADIKDQENYIIKIQSWVLTEKVEQAKEMEKEKMIKFTNDWYNCYWKTHPMKSAEKFYNEIFKNK